MEIIKMRGDSGMSDSQFIRFQNLMKEKVKKFSAKLDDEQQTKRAFKLKKDNLTFWDKIGLWLKRK